MIDDLYLWFDKGCFDSLKEQFIDNDYDEQSSSGKTPGYDFGKLTAGRGTKIKVIGNVLRVEVRLVYPENDQQEKLGVIEMNIPISASQIIELMEYYQKQVNKLKTILEAAK